MPTIQINLFICEVCGYISHTRETESMYMDPVIYPPNDEEWGFVGEHPNERMACPTCCSKRASDEGK